DPVRVDRHGLDHRAQGLLGHHHWRLRRCEGRHCRRPAAGRGRELRRALYLGALQRRVRVPSALHLPAAAPARHLRRKSLGESMNKPLKIAFFAALGLLVAGAPLVLPLSPYVLNMLMQTCTYAVAVLGMTVVLGYAGQINLAQATFFGLGAYAVGLGTVVAGI